MTNALRAVSRSRLHRRQTGIRSRNSSGPEFFERGHIVVFNDLAHRLHLGDLTKVKDGKARTFEVKANAEEYLKRGTMRQIALPLTVHKYIEDE
jgi:hypothetical protein